MAIVFFIILFLALLILVVTLSTLQIRIKKASISNMNSKKIEYDYLAFIELKFWGKLKIMQIEINKEKVSRLSSKLRLKEKIAKVDFKKVEKGIPNKKERKKLQEKLDIKLDEFHLKAEIGTYDVIITSAIIAVIASAIGIVMAKLIDNYKKEKYEYIIIPVYKNKNVINLSLNCIIQVKMVHIISIIFTLLRKRKEKRKYVRTSNRRSYDYSYGQY